MLQAQIINKRISELQPKQVRAARHLQYEVQVITSLDRVNLVCALLPNLHEVLLMGLMLP
jgi:hypothetical protein